MDSSDIFSPHLNKAQKHQPVTGAPSDSYPYSGYTPTNIERNSSLGGSRISKDLFTLGSQDKNSAGSSNLPVLTHSGAVLSHPKAPKFAWPGMCCSDSQVSDWHCHPIQDQARCVFTISEPRPLLDLNGNFTEEVRDRKLLSARGKFGLQYTFNYCDKNDPSIIQRVTREVKVYCAFNPRLTAGAGIKELELTYSFKFVYWEFWHDPYKADVYKFRVADSHVFDGATWARQARVSLLKKGFVPGGDYFFRVVSKDDFSLTTGKINTEFGPEKDEKHVFGYLKDPFEYVVTTYDVVNRRRVRELKTARQFYRAKGLRGSMFFDPEATIEGGTPRNFKFSVTHGTNSMYVFQNDRDGFALANVSYSGTSGASANYKRII